MQMQTFCRWFSCTALSTPSPIEPGLQISEVRRVARWDGADGHQGARAPHELLACHPLIGLIARHHFLPFSRAFMATSGMAFFYHSFLDAVAATYEGIVE